MYDRLFQAETRKDARRRIGEPSKLFAVDDLAAQDLALKLLGLDDHRRGLANERGLSFRQIRCPAKIIGERHAQVAIAARGGRSSVDIRKQVFSIGDPAAKRSRAFGADMDIGQPDLQISGELIPERYPCIMSGNGSFAQDRQNKTFPDMFVKNGT